jgi:hypothetical protein
MLSDLLWNGVKVDIMWIPSHVGLKGNKHEWLRHPALNDAVFEEVVYPPFDLKGLAKSVLLREWQGKWDAADIGRFAHSILPNVSIGPWFEGKMEDKKFFLVIVLLGHTRVDLRWSKK